MANSTPDLTDAAVIAGLRAQAREWLASQNDTAQAAHVNGVPETVVPPAAVATMAPAAIAATAVPVSVSAEPVVQAPTPASKGAMLLSPAIRKPPRRGLWSALAGGLRWLFLIKPKVLIIERYLWGEAFGQFLLGTLGFTLFMVVTSIFALGDKIFSKNIPAFTVVKVLLLYAPGMIVLAIPVAVVFSTLMAMGRLNRDNEIVAMQTNGISLYRIFIPFVTLALIAGLVSFYMFDSVAPRATKQAIDILKIFWKAQVVDFIKPGIVISAPQQKYFYVDEIHKEQQEDGVLRSTMYNIRLYDYFKESGGIRNFPRIFVGKKAWVADQYLVLSDVTLYNLDERTGKNLVSAHMPEIQIDIGTRILEENLDPQPEEMNWRQLRDRVMRTRDRIKSAGFLRSQYQQNYLKDWTAYYLKFSIPFACLTFVLVAVPVSLRGPRDERNMGIILTFVLVMTYYIILFSARTLGSRGLMLGGGFNLFGAQLIDKGANFLPPYVAGWLAPAVFIVAAFVLIKRARK
jgi:lipopolysaccharide export LptBFGC system permease protein LptF